MTTITELIEQLETTNDCDQVIVRDLCTLFKNHKEYPSISVMIVRAINDSSIDAALALVEKVLPGWSWHIESALVPPGVWSEIKPLPRARLSEPIETAYGHGIKFRADFQASTPSIAILIALLRAVEAKE